MSLSKRVCPICDEREVTFLRHFSFILFDGHPLTDGYDLVCCNHCGFIYADTTITQKDYDDFYQNFSIYEEKDILQKSEYSWWDQQRFQETAKQIKKIVPSHEFRILDIGCANGRLLSEFIQLGYKNVQGIDPSPICVRNTQKSGIPATQCSITNIPSNLGAFDCIVLSHVLEHIYDIKQGIRNIYDILALNGIIYVEVPDANRYADFVVSPFQDFNTEHINHFSQQSISNLFSQFNLVQMDLGSKEILSSPNNPYPAIYSFWKKENTDGFSKALKRDNFLKSEIQRYIEKSQNVLDSLERRISNTLHFNPEIIVWGTGQLAMRLLAETILGASNIVAYVDGNPINHGKKIKGIRVLTPNEAKELKQPILITTLLHQEEISKIIRDELKMENVILSLFSNEIEF